MKTLTKRREEIEKQRLTAYNLGLNAVRMRPKYAPRNPFDEDKHPLNYAAWEEGAYAAGITQIYHNGELKE